MRVHCVGARFYGGQVQGIEDGFRALGHEVTPHVSEGDLVYVNDIAHHKQAVADKLTGVVRGKLVLNVQDLPFHLGANWDYEGVARLLAHADAVTTISEYVQWQVKSRLGLDSTVVYQPIKSVTRRPDLARKPFYRFLHVGRRSDQNKRATLGAVALQLLGFAQRDLCMVGNEPGWGDYLGVLSDENLNVVYNSVDFVLCTSAVEGLLLPCLESMAAGVVPIVCRDMTTRTELLPPDLFPEYETVEPTPASVAAFIAALVNEDSGARLGAMKDRLYGHFAAVWADRVSPEGVAGRIAAVYEGLVGAEDCRHAERGCT